MVWWVTSDPCGIFCAAFTVFLLVYAELVMGIYVIVPWLGFDVHFILFTTLTIFALVAHTRCQFTDPGCVPSYYLPPNLPQDINFGDINVRPYSPPKICRTCRTLKTRRTFHCNTSNRCIVNLDHFCVWCNNDVGVLNHRWFFQFLFFTAASCLYCAGLLVARFISCNSNTQMCEMTSGATVFCIITFIESLVFGIFTIVMLYDQVFGLLDEEFRNEQFYKTQMIAYEQAMQTDAKYFSDPPIQPIKKSTHELFIEIFGAPFGISWFNPFTRPEPVAEVFYNEMNNCVRQADKVTEKFVTFARKLQSGEIVLNDSSNLDNIDEGTGLLDVHDFGDEDEDFEDDSDVDALPQHMPKSPPQQSSPQQLKEQLQEQNQLSRRSKPKKID